MHKYYISAKETNFSASHSRAQFNNQTKQHRTRNAHTYIYICIYIYIYIYVYIYTCMCLCVYMYVYIYMYIYTCIYIYVYIYMYIHICMCICIWTRTYIHAYNTHKHCISAKETYISASHSRTQFRNQTKGHRTRNAHKYIQTYVYICTRININILTVPSKRYKPPSRVFGSL